MVEIAAPQPMRPGPPPPGGPRSPHVRSIPRDIVLSLITCGIFNLVVQYKQMEAVNAMLGEPRYSFGTWFLLSLITCGIYHIYFEYRFMRDIVEATRMPPTSNEPILCLVLAIFGMTIVADALQQTHINRYYGVETV